MTSPGTLAGRVALVTGASRRIAIGAAIARRLVADGAAVLVHSWSPHDAEQPWGADEGGAEALVEERFLGPLTAGPLTASPLTSGQSGTRR